MARVALLSEDQKKQNRQQTVKTYNDAHKDDIMKYDKETYKKILVRFNQETESDLIDFLWSQPDGASTHLKNLLKKELEESRQ